MELERIRDQLLLSFWNSLQQRSRLAGLRVLEEVEASFFTRVNEIVGAIFRDNKLRVQREFGHLDWSDEMTLLAIQELSDRLATLVVASATSEERKDIREGDIYIAIHDQPRIPIWPWR